MKYYCSLPWRHIAIRPNGDVLPCCRFRKEKYGNVSEKFDFINNENIKNLRELTLKDNPITGCEKCYFQEENQIKSMRQNYTDFNNILTTPKLNYLEIAFSNHCNLKCRMCSSYFSSKWVEDEKAIGIKYHENLLSNTFDFDINDLDHLKVLGGEPFLSKQFKNKCLEIENKKKLRLEIITNGTFPLPAELIAAAEKIQQLSITVSLDAHGNLNDYIRHGSNFNTIEKNLMEYSKFLKEFSFEKLSIHTCVMIYNVNYIPEFYAKMFDNYDLKKISIDTVSKPKELDIRNLPNDVKNAIVNIYQEYESNMDTKQKEILNKILKYLNEPANMDITSVKKYHNLLNSIRNETLAEKNLLISNILEK